MVVDDKCPENTGKLVKNYKIIKNLIIHFNKKNLGVGGAVLQGYKILINNKCDILVKIDGDDQMKQTQMINLIKPIINDGYHYTKGNRFMNVVDKKKIPKIRFYGNYLISIFSKFTTGYWDIFDYLNGFTAINCKSAKKIINLNIDKKFFFETDVLFKLNDLKARVKDVRVSINYKENKSNFLPHKEFKNFFFKNIQRFFFRIKTRYYNCQNDFYNFISINFICSIIANFIYFSFAFVNNELSVNSNIPIFIYFVFSSIFFFWVDYLNNPNFKR